MKDRRYLCILLGFLCSPLRAEILEVHKTPNTLPQTTFNVGISDYTFHAKNKNIDYKWTHKGKTANTYGFDIEIPYNDYANIGVYFRFDYYSEKLAAKGLSDFEFRMANYLGAFTRFQYAPFGTKYLNLFTRVDVGAGPIIMKFSGLSAQAVLHFGIESYVNDWLGVALSYGIVEEWGRETLMGSSGESDANTFKNITIHSSGRMILLGLKTTYF
jgi:hypothetical protein